MMDHKLSIAWDAYQKNICNGLQLLQQRQEFVDMTIAADGHHVKVHQMIMSLVSPYIKDLITSSPSAYPVIFLNKVSHQTLLSILEYAYTGEVLVPRDRLCEFLEACNSLHIRGLECDNLKTLKTIGDGDLLHLLGAKGDQDEETVQTTQTPATENFTQLHQRVVSKEMDLPKEDDTYKEESYLINDDLEMDDNDNNVTNETVFEHNPQHSELKRNIPQSSTNSMVQYSLSCQGSIQLVLNRYIYCMRHTRKSNERMWRCTGYKKYQCRAYAVTRGDMVLERGCAHNHPFQDKQVLKRVRNGNLYAAFNAVENIASLSKKVQPCEAERKKDKVIT